MYLFKKKNYLQLKESLQRYMRAQMHMRDANAGNVPWNNFSPTREYYKTLQKNGCSTVKVKVAIRFMDYFCKFLFDVSVPHDRGIPLSSPRVESARQLLFLSFTFAYIEHRQNFRTRHRASSRTRNLLSRKTYRWTKIPQL